jgi:hypothetical protein
MRKYNKTREMKGREHKKPSKKGREDISWFGSVEKEGCRAFAMPRISETGVANLSSQFHRSSSIPATILRGNSEEYDPLRLDSRVQTEIVRRLGERSRVDTEEYQDEGTE